jgi:hypothetical protein
MHNHNHTPTRHTRPPAGVQPADRAGGQDRHRGEAGEPRRQQAGGQAASSRQGRQLAACRALSAARALGVGGRGVCVWGGGGGRALGPPGLPLAAGGLGAPWLVRKHRRGVGWLLAWAPGIAMVGRRFAGIGRCWVHEAPRPWRSGQLGPLVHGSNPIRAAAAAAGGRWVIAGVLQPMPRLRAYYRRFGLLRCRVDPQSCTLITPVAGEGQHGARMDNRQRSFACGQRSSNTQYMLADAGKSVAAHT